MPTSKRSRMRVEWGFSSDDVLEVSWLAGTKLGAHVMARPNTGNICSDRIKRQRGRPTTQAVGVAFNGVGIEAHDEIGGVPEPDKAGWCPMECAE